ncbi:MAG: DNA primase catalytic subunit PriS [Thermoplasmataceae archaeon]
MRNEFKNYYEVAKLLLPDKFSSREIGYIPFNGPMTRHGSISSILEFSSFIKQLVPKHLYYSVAYYDNPLERVMADKGWNGAELIFDLDADHIEGASNMTYEEILSEVKNHTKRLIEKYLLGLLSFSEDEIYLYFSGGRGYHVHVKSERVYNLSSDSRREIANLVRGEGITAKEIRQNPSLIKEEGDSWVKEIDDFFCSIIRECSEENGGEILNSIFKDGRTANGYLSSLKKPAGKSSINKNRGIVLSKGGPEKYRYFEENDLRVLEFAVSEVKKKEACEIDEPVSTDLHRLIRFPGSLHGKTGLEVVQIPLEEFTSFDPLRDAIPGKFKTGEIKINTPKKIEIRFDGEIFKLEGTETIRRDLAIFLISSGRSILE